ncbi:hypothetical protein [Pseudoalteromonas sp. BDTF-M6]|uniref:hypothetical protein n=1 Tax=Pseudoalteromonas sp. BDTF-M6 TaxID=2796132 RepID=UPI001BAEFCC7|nr:hypothetical protein [Pseudoalteromonas sp. BDTF-M6]MBS3797746.1 hypothetical protein [Pseudoalteromonas sp. BDTF-M6]
MNNEQRNKIISTSWELHSLVESGYLSHTAAQGDPLWLEKQRILLADMAIHLLQTSLQPGDLELEKLKNNLHAILTISDQFLPQSGLKKVTKDIYK